MSFLQPHRLSAVEISWFDEFMGACEGSEGSEDWGGPALGLAYAVVQHAETMDDAYVPWRVMSNFTFTAQVAGRVRRNAKNTAQWSWLASSGRGVAVRLVHNPVRKVFQERADHIINLMVLADAAPSPGLFAPLMPRPLITDDNTLPQWRRNRILPSLSSMP